LTNLVNLGNASEITSSWDILTLAKDDDSKDTFNSKDA
jgi:hypothetical protein